MARKFKRIAGPAYIANSATNIFAPNSALKYTITHIHVANKDTAATQAFSLFVDTTGGSTGGKELVKNKVLAAAAAGATGAEWDYYGALVLDGAQSTDFLVGIADAASKCVITVEGFVEASG